ncbi:hypothetical protein JM18_006111 [Phytophthora kernoviae]|uniref:Serine aminopeptidase S33 domain-containing protein n=2 Tax=Phytophthora kernoviae TaxID=325452 RepID=A0A8T0LI71_9STRA|nr:hypothetical protein G195_011308 [Phytophthora kernoviae 00238/432]KAG2503558.1 hypothetical protein JM16_009441 [Phytophthora kernoviae]KAG2520952.1 hypothetical protein JM18_006111 [Phytophthora kernoviae]
MATRPRVNSSLRALHMPVHLRQLEGTFKNDRGQNLSYLALFPPVDTPLRAVVLYLHGIGDHSRRYFHLYERLCNAGFGVLAYDLLSHGASDSDEHGLRAHSARFHYFVDDTNEFIKMAKSQLYPQLQVLPPNQPPMVLSALLVEMTKTLRVQAVFARPLSKFIPKARIVPGVNGDYLCRDQDYVDDFTADPLTITAPVTARMGAETLKAMRALEADERVEQADSALCKLPMLMLMGSQDKVTSLELAQVFFERLAASDKEFKVFDGYFHSLFDDPEREAVFEHLDKWLQTRFPAIAKVDTVDEVNETAETNTEVAEAVPATEEMKAQVVESVSTTPAVEVETESAESISTPAKEEPKTETVNDNTTVTEEPKTEAVDDSSTSKEELKTEIAVESAGVPVTEEVKAQVVESISTTPAVEVETESAESISTPAKEEPKTETVNDNTTVTEEPKTEAVDDSSTSKEELKTEIAVESAGVPVTEEVKSAASDDSTFPVPVKEESKVEAAESNEEKPATPAETAGKSITVSTKGETQA